MEVVGSALGLEVGVFDGSGEGAGLVGSALGLNVGSCEGSDDGSVGT